MSTPKEDSHWSEHVETHHVKDKNIFNKSAEEIAKYFGDARVTPQGPGRAVNRLQFYINRAGSHGNAEHIAKAKEAIRILQAREDKKEGKVMASAEVTEKNDAHHDIRRVIKEIYHAADFLKEHDLTDVSDPVIGKTLAYIRKATHHVESLLPVAEPAVKETEAKHD